MRVLMIVLAMLAAGCVSPQYRDAEVAKFTGALDVRWVKNDYFLFLPNKENPFTLERKGGAKIQPREMYVDGGSIPRFLWGIKGYSPWGYAPAYIVHDWLFIARHCGYAPDNKFSFDDSVKVLAEGLKAVMEADPKVRNYFVFDSVVGAVSSPIARRLWEKGSCQPPLIEERALAGAEPPGELLMTIQFK